MLLALAGARADLARAGQVVSNEVLFASGTSVEREESFPLGAFDPAVNEDYGYYWYSDPTNELGWVREYDGSVAAYDYAEHGLTRNPYLVSSEGSQNKRYLSLTAEQGLHRSVFSRLYFDDAFSNVVVRSGARESIYCDTLARFVANEEFPTAEDNDRLLVWVRLIINEDGSRQTNLMVTAGYVTNGFTKAASKDYPLDVPPFDVSKWYRLTIRAHGDVSTKGTGVSAFSIYLDGEPLRWAASDAICDDDSRAAYLLTPEARALKADRRLFFGLPDPGVNEAYTISGLTFTGDGFVDDVTFSSDDPGFGKSQSESVFTLNWDAGVKSLGYSLDGGRTTNAVTRLAPPRSTDILIGHAPTNGFTLKVYAEYDGDKGYHAGAWSGSNGASLTNATPSAYAVAAGDFVYDASSSNRNPVASVSSTRNSFEIGPGEGRYDVFAAAIAAMNASTNAQKVLVLMTNVLVSVTNKTAGYCDRGRVYFDSTATNAEYVLDLNGHTLQGLNGRYGPTLCVKCPSLRICDSGDPDPVTGKKKGRILPVQSITNANENLNTAVLVYPQAAKGVRPVLTIEDGIFDGWVNNKPDESANVTGSVQIAGGRFLSTNSASFYLDSCVTNPSLAYVCRSEVLKNYWVPLTNDNTVVWTGLGDGSRWADGGNWRSGRVPATNEIAFFPSRAAALGPWSVDVETNGMSTASIWMEHDIRLSGTNDFTKVAVAGDGAGRICGNARLVFDGTPPGLLTETMLRANCWSGTVVLTRIGTDASRALTGIDTWGTAASTVIFNGVRGHVDEARSYTMPYAFVLSNLDDAPAWRNESGSTGATLAFTGALSGSGTFETADESANYQTIRFADVSKFRGKFTVNGKRVRLGGEGTVGLQSGLLSYADLVKVQSDLGWSCKTAAFGSNLLVIGDTNDVLVVCTDAKPDVTTCTNVCVAGCTNRVWLTCAGDSPWTVRMTCERPAWALTSVSSDADAQTGSNGFISSLSAAPASNELSSFASAALRAAKVAAAESAISEAETSLELEDGHVFVVIRNAAVGQWYGVRHRASLAANWDDESQWKWKRATATTVEISYPIEDSAGFYGIVGSVDGPLTGEILSE